MPRFDPAAVLDVMEREQVGLWIGVPTMYWALLQHVKSAGIDPSAVAKHLRLCVSGGAAMPLEVMRQFESVFGARILEGYGLSETSPVACFNQLHRPTKPGTVGQPIFGVEVRCVDDEDRFLAIGQPGEVVIRGPNIMKGYYNRPEATEDAMRHGWFHTGDIGVLDADGYLCDRRSQEGHDHSRRVQRLSARDRRSDADASGGCAGRRRRRPGRAASGKRSRRSSSAAPGPR